MKKTLNLLLISLIMIGLHAQDPDPADQDSTEIYQAPVVQEKSPSKLKDKIYFGGNIGLTFGSYTSIGIYPLIGYKITPKLSAGLKISYQYIQDKRYSSNYSTSNYGGSLFTRYRIIQPLYLHVEYEMTNFELYNSIGESERTWVPFLFVGAGYSQRLGGKSWLNIQVLFDVLQNANSPYNNWEPFYSIGVGVGF
jgi:hypothetical protein